MVCLCGLSWLSHSWSSLSSAKEGEPLTAPDLGLNGSRSMCSLVILLTPLPRWCSGPLAAALAPSGRSPPAARPGRSWHSRPCTLAPTPLGIPGISYLVAKKQQGALKGMSVCPLTWNMVVNESWALSSGPQLRSETARPNQFCHFGQVTASSWISMFSSHFQKPAVRIMWQNDAELRLGSWESK